MKNQTKSTIRTRIAPSPTGPLHIGTSRTALFNYLFAKQNKGEFILRIEDTDKERSKVKWVENIKQGLKWLGLTWDEEYKQSERTKIYKEYLGKLLKSKKAYWCYCTEDELNIERAEQQSRGESPKYSGKCRELTKEEIEKNLSEEKAYVLRFKTPAGKIAFNDMLRGKIEYDASGFGDMVVAKGMAEPLYNLACVIDDFEMQITHVIRGEDHIPNTPKQLLIARALGISPPQYLHLPLILAPDKSKLSKRHGAVSLPEYKEHGYLPGALVNFLALLGWNPGDEREVFTMQGLIKEFSVEKLQKSGAVFNIVKLDWLNGHYIRNMALNELTELCVPYLTENELIVPLWGQKELIVGAYKMPFDVIDYQIVETGERKDFGYLKAAVGLYQERLKKLSEIAALVDYLFKKELNYPAELLKWKDMQSRGVKGSLDTSSKLLGDIKERNWSEKKIMDILIKETNRTGDRGRLLWPLRVALSGKKASAGPFEIAGVLGKEKTLQRIKQAIVKMNNEL